MDTPIKTGPDRTGMRPDNAPPGPADIHGWGADLDHANRPAYPMERRPQRLDVDDRIPLPQQMHDERVLHSIERPGLTPVFGTTVPPSGVSGAMRRIAFRFSESDLRHWLLLLLADRVNVVEGVASDLSRGHVPNLYREMGGRAELRHNPLGAAKKVMLLAGVAGLGYWAWQRRVRQRAVPGD